MDYTNHNTTTRTNKHLDTQERFYIEKRMQAGDSVTAIARALGRSRTTIYTELARGTVIQVKQAKLTLMYLADRGQLVYEKSRQRSFRTLKVSQIEPFLAWVEDKVRTEQWSLAAAVGAAHRLNLFDRSAMVCTKTLYNYLHQSILSLTPMDLPLILRRSTRKAASRQHKHKLGKSIELRDPQIASRKEFGHWEIDTVRGIRDKNDEVLVTLLERKSRLYTALRCPSAKAGDVKRTLLAWLGTFTKSSELKALCKTITADNGKEFAEIAELETDSLQIYFAHPYSAWERGSNERHNGLLRRFIAKGTPIKEVSEDTLKRAIYWCNNLPRRLFGYKSPQAVFLEEVRKLVDLESVQFQIAI